MNPVMYILVERDNPMSAGKLGAQIGHAAVEAYRLSCKQDEREPGNFQESSIANRWRRGGHYTKIVLMTDDLNTAFEYIGARGFNVVKIIDEGRTEVSPLTRTALGVEIVDKDSAHVQDTFGLFKLYNPPSMVVVEKPMTRRWNLHARGTWRPGRLWYPAD